MMNKVQVPKIFASDLPFEPARISGNIEFSGNIAPPPTNAETLRHIAQSISGDEPMKAIFAAMLTRAADELDAKHEALKLAVGTLALHGYDDDAKKVVAEWKSWEGKAGALPESVG
jgi:hypothetical protein